MNMNHKQDIELSLSLLVIKYKNKLHHQSVSQTCNHLYDLLQPLINAKPIQKGYSVGHLIEKYGLTANKTSSVTYDFNTDNCLDLLRIIKYLNREATSSINFCQIEKSHEMLVKLIKLNCLKDIKSLKFDHLHNLINDCLIHIHSYELNLRVIDFKSRLLFTTQLNILKNFKYLINDEIISNYTIRNHFQNHTICIGYINVMFKVVIGTLSKKSFLDVDISCFQNLNKELSESSLRILITMFNELVSVESQACFTKLVNQFNQQLCKKISTLKFPLILLKNYLLLIENYHQVFPISDNYEIKSKLLSVLLLYDDNTLVKYYQKKFT